MNHVSKNNSLAECYVLPRWMRGWEKFWFTPADPTLLALMRIACGAIVSYTLFVYTFKLQDFMGPHAWLDLKLRMENVRNRPMNAGPLLMPTAPQLPPAANDFQKEYLIAYQEKWGTPPPPPYPIDEDQADYLDAFRKTYRIDLRTYGLKPPTTQQQRDYVEHYVKLWRALPPAYAKDEKEAREIDEYRKATGYDPRQLYTRGTHIFSLWFHVTDPQAMQMVHWCIVAVAVLFTLGFCTRLTSALTWFGSLCYIHRNPAILFGADTMITILLTYLMIGPCGATLSLDQAIRRWWNKDNPAPSRPEPSVSANVAIRLLQINLCMIYCIAGLAKLLGPAWWNGTAIWGTIANYEFAPMQHAYYMEFLRLLANNNLLINIFMTGGGLFTLAFEISYIYLIWRPSLRWVFLGSALLLHGGIGMFMGLKTFALLMLVMNMAFLTKEEVYRILDWFGVTTGASSTSSPPPLPESAREPAGSSRAVASVR